jgi:hypothetical protein
MLFRGKDERRKSRAAEFLLLFVTIFGYDEAFFGCCGLRRTALSFMASLF